MLGETDEHDVAVAAALTDLILMTEDAAMFLTGPGVVREALGEEIDAAALGGPRVHDRNGVCHLVERDVPAAAARVRELLSYLPSAAGEAPPLAEPVEPDLDDPGRVVPSEPRRSYDVRDALVGIMTPARCSSYTPDGDATSSRRWPAWTGAQSRSSPTSRTTSAACSTPSAPKSRAVRQLLDSFGLPLIAVVDTPGFMPGSRQEQAGVIRHGASLVRAFAAAQVPKVTVVLRKSYGGAYITMNSRDLGADLVLAWPEAELGIMRSLSIDHALDAAGPRHPSCWASVLGFGSKADVCANIVASQVPLPDISALANIAVHAGACTKSGGLAFT